ARTDAERYRDQPGMAELARFYERFYGSIGRAFHDRYGRDVVGQFRRLRGEGNLDVLTSAATHGYLPLMRRDSTIHGQLRTGLQASRRHMGGPAHGIWLPECGYRPAYFDEGGTYKPGIEEYLADLKLRYFFTETFVVAGGQ